MRRFEHIREEIESEFAQIDELNRLEMYTLEPEMLEIWGETKDEDMHNDKRRKDRTYNDQPVHNDWLKLFFLFSRYQFRNW